MYCGEYQKLKKILKIYINVLPLEFIRQETN